MSGRFLELPVENYSGETGKKNSDKAYNKTRLGIFQGLLFERIEFIVFDDPNKKWFVLLDFFIAFIVANLGGDILVGPGCGWMGRRFDGMCWRIAKRRLSDGERVWFNLLGIVISAICAIHAIVLLSRLN